MRRGFEGAALLAPQHQQFLKNRKGLTEHPWFDVRSTSFNGQRVSISIRLCKFMVSLLFS